MRRGAIIAFALLLASCYDRFGSGSPQADDMPAPDTSIATVRNSYYGSPVAVGEDITVAGRVTANDVEDNFYRTFVIDDGTAALEILAGTSPLHRVYPIGLYVTVALQGTVIDASRGVCRAGLPAPAGSGYASDYFAAQEVLDLHVSRSLSLETPQPVETTLDALDESLCGRLIRIGNLHRVPAEEETERPVFEGEHIFADANERLVTLYTSPYARFAQRAIPAGEVSLCGILYRDDKGVFSIRMRYETDCTPCGDTAGDVMRQR